jgi:alanyl-tRNA synthetase
MGQAYPELLRAEALISETLKLEESRFRTTLARGLTLLDDASRDLTSGQSLKGEVAFTLYDTYGFPLDLTQDALRARGVSVDTAGFDAAMQQQKAKARAAWSGTGEAATETLWFPLRDKVGATEFLGYDTESAEGVITALIRDNAEVETLNVGERGFVIVNQTPFYGESGGQLGDTGIIRAAGALAEVGDVQKKLGDVFVHVVTVKEGALKRSQPVELVVDHARRSAIRANHSATHLLHEGLRLVLGDHVAQKGSLVSPDRLRFDFSHPKPISDEELARVEDIANAIVLRNEPVTTRQMSVDDAIASGARALFGEKYGEEVRVVAMGTREEDGKAFSIELCGGTHAGRTGDIGLVSVVAESAVAAGVRRLEAMTGAAARRELNMATRRLDVLAGLLKVPAGEAEARLATLIEERRKLDRELTDARKKLAMGGGGAAEDPVREIAGAKLLARAVTGVEMKDLKSLADEAKARIGSGVVAIVGVAEDGKAGVVVGVTQDMVARFDAVALVRAASEQLGGKGGGGRRDMAQAGGPDGEKAQAALDAVAAAMG